MTQPLPSFRLVAPPHILVNNAGVSDTRGALDYGCAYSAL
jgi:hypothetical protein